MKPFFIIMLSGIILLASISYIPTETKAWVIDTHNWDATLTYYSLSAGYTLEDVKFNGQMYFRAINIPYHYLALGGNSQTTTFQECYHSGTYEYSDSGSGGTERTFSFYDDTAGPNQGCNNFEYFKVTFTFYNTGKLEITLETETSNDQIRQGFIFMDPTPSGNENYGQEQWTYYKDGRYSVSPVRQSLVPKFETAFLIDENEGRFYTETSQSEIYINDESGASLDDYIDIKLDGADGFRDPDDHVAVQYFVNKCTYCEVATDSQYKFHPMYFDDNVQEIHGEDQHHVINWRTTTFPTQAQTYRDDYFKMKIIIQVHT